MKRKTSVSTSAQKAFVNSILFFVLLITSFALLLATIIFTAPKIDPNKHWHVVLTFDKAYGDSGFNQQAVEGACDANGNCDFENKNFQEYLSYGYAGSSSNTSKIYDYILNAFHTKGIKNFILPGYNYSNFLFEKSEKLKQLGIKVIAIDTYFSSGDSWTSNWLHQFSYRHYYAGYHAGLYAGAFALKNSSHFKDADSSKDGKQIRFASLGGLNIPPIMNYALGFRLGLEMTNSLNEKNNFKDNDETGSTVELYHSDYEIIGGFSPVSYGEKAESLARKLYDSGVSIIFVIAASLALNVAEVATETEKNSKRHFVVGVDVDQGQIFHEEDSDNVPEKITERGVFLTSAVINLRVITKNLVKNFNSGKNQLVHGHKKDDEEYGTIPKRHQKNQIWKDLKKKLEESCNTFDLVQLLTNLCSQTCTSCMLCASCADLTIASIQNGLNDHAENYIDKFVSKGTFGSPEQQTAAKTILENKFESSQCNSQQTNNCCCCSICETLKKVKTKSNEWKDKN